MVLLSWNCSGEKSAKVGASLRKNKLHEHVKVRFVAGRLCSVCARRDGNIEYCLGNAGCSKIRCVEISWKVEHYQRCASFEQVWSLEDVLETWSFTVGAKCWGLP